MIPNLHIFESPEELAEQLADELINLFGQHKSGAFHLAISGGKTPNLLFTALAEKYAQSPVWENVHFWWVDERMVPANHPESNYGTAHQLLFSRIIIPDENIHRIKGENNPEAEALSYSGQIQKKVSIKNGWPAFDLILLGMGDDGHTASIFPDQMHLFETNRICEVAVHPQSRQKRVTLTGKSINSALRVWFVVTGENKAERLKEISMNQESAKSLPATQIQPKEGELRWYVDKAAIQKIIDSPLG